MTREAPLHPHAPLRGLRVVEWSRSIAAAYAARLLADAGASVAKVEPPTGDPARVAGPFPGDQSHPERSGLYAYLNRGKRSVVLDVDRAEGRDALRRLARAADVFVHDQPALATSALGLSAQTLRAASSRLIVTAVTPFGKRGPRAGWRADDLVVVAASDLAFATPGLPDYVQDAEAEPPRRPDANVGEYVGGLGSVGGAALAFVVGPAAAAGVSLAVGALAVRRSGVYFAMLTLAFAQVGSFFGPAIGAVVYGLLVHATSAAGERAQGALGLALLAIVLLFPRGLSMIGERAWRLLRRALQPPKAGARPSAGPEPGAAAEPAQREPR